MKTINVTQARKDIYNLIKEVNASHEPIEITGKQANGILISKDDWSAISETLHLCSIKGMHESIQKGMNTDLEDCSKDLDW